MASDPKRRAGRVRVEVERARIPPPLKSPDEVAAYLAVSVLGVYRRLREGRLRGHKVGGQWRIPDDAVRQYLEESICAFVDTLFIDEGFGSLDRDTLDVAIDALEALQGQGRKVGLITHVQAMIERIAVQVRVEKRGGGRSVIRMSNANTEGSDIRATLTNNADHAAA